MHKNTFYLVLLFCVALQFGFAGCSNTVTTHTRITLQMQYNGVGAFTNNIQGTSLEALFQGVDHNKRLKAMYVVDSDPVFDPYYLSFYTPKNIENTTEASCLYFWVADLNRPIVLGKAPTIRQITQGNERCYVYECNNDNPCPHNNPFSNQWAFEVRYDPSVISTKSTWQKVFDIYFEWK